MTKFIAVWKETRDDGVREDRFEVVECGNLLSEMYDAFREKGMFDFEIQKATIYVVSEEFRGKLVVEGPR